MCHKDNFPIEPKPDELVKSLDDNKIYKAKLAEDGHIHCNKCALDDDWNLCHLILCYRSTRKDKNTVYFEEYGHD